MEVALKETPDGGQDETEPGPGGEPSLVTPERENADVGEKVQHDIKVIWRADGG